VTWLVHGVSAKHLRNPAKYHCQITNNIAKILQNFSIKRFALTMDPILIASLNLFRQNLKFRSGRPGEPRALGPCGPLIPPPIVMLLVWLFQEAVVRELQIIV